MTLRLTIPCRLLALCVPLVATQASASALNEYTLSPSEMNATVTTFGDSYQPSYQAQPAQPSYQTQPSYQPAAPATPQFGEIVYDSAPYLPDGTGTDTYTIQPMQQPTYLAPATN